MVEKDVMNVAFLSLGGNLSNRLDNLNKTIKAISESCGVVSKMSNVYETEAWGTLSEKKYLNQLIQLKTPLSAQKLLTKVLEIETRLGRKRTLNQYADRTVDIDILYFNQEIIQQKNLQIPHPRLQLRKFILIPLNEIAPAFVHPILHKSSIDLLKNCKDKLKVDIYPDAKQIKYICIEGNIGSGKSTLAKVLSKKLKAQFLAEKFEENLLLPLFYAQPKVYAFPLEYSFLISRFEQLKKSFKNPAQIVVSDFDIHKCLWFAKVNLQKNEYALFKKHFDGFVKQLPKPDLIIYLNADIKKLLQNIEKRGRTYEKSISAHYLKAVSKQYEKGLQKMTKIKKMEFKIDTYHPKLEVELVKNIEKYVKENFG